MSRKNILKGIEELSHPFTQDQNHRNIFNKFNFGNVNVTVGEIQIKQFSLAALPFDHISP